MQYDWTGNRARRSRYIKITASLLLLLVLLVQFLL